ncbi:FUSC family protein [Nocardioides sp. BP30]|uniref:FUSC family protein n=1 Tax=Nocardioides sp. BP30 TaxID=3036374 RepID=UPI0024690362|nr:FUSC family protein [Nocardioides sp. BP30]WGL53614.1 FUSC family protein [Nocardioides sp. BP30]
MPADVLRSLVAVGPSNGAHRIALRAAISVLVPLLVLDATGHLSWTMYAAFGSFTSLYGRERVDTQRVRLQLVAGGWMVGCVTVGALIAASDQRGWLAVPVAAAVASAAAYRSAVEGWHPPGSLFQVFGIAAVASVPGTLADVVPALLVAVASASFAVVVGNLGALVRRVRRSAVVEAAVPIGGSTAGAGRYALLAGLGVLVAGSLAQALDIGRPYWAMVSAVVPLAARALPAQVIRGVHRLVGTALGLLVAWALLSFDLHGAAAIVAVGVLQALAELVVGRNYALALTFITPLALLMGNVVRPVPTGTLLADRAAETVIGVAVGVAVGWFLRPRPDAIG